MHAYNSKLNSDQVRLVICDGTYLRSGSQRHRHCFGSLTGPTKHRHALGYGGHILDLSPGVKIVTKWVLWCFTSHATISQLYMWRACMQADWRSCSYGPCPNLLRGDKIFFPSDCKSGLLQPPDLSSLPGGWSITCPTRMSLFIFLLYNIYHLCFTCIDFYDLTAWGGC